MDDPATRLYGPRGVTDNVQHGNILTECTANAAQSTQFTGPERGDQGPEPFLARVAIRGIRTDEFVWCPNPRKALFGNQIEKSKLKVYAMRIRQRLKGP